MARRSSFQTLALWTTGTTYFLILVGGLVRASGAGLGCPDWPRCFGGWIPPGSAADLPAGFDPSQFNATLMWTEYLNRLLGVAVGLLILASLISAWRHHRQTPRIFRPTLAAFLLVGFQGWLGGVVVQQELTAWIVTVHMVVALVIVSLLLYATVYSFFATAGVAVQAQNLSAHTQRPRSRAGDGPGTPASSTRPLLVWSTWGLIVLTLVQVIVGTQVREGIDHALDAGVARGDALATVGRFDMWHRDVALLVVAATAWIYWLVWTRHRAEPAMVRTTYLLAALVGLQVLVGASMAYLTLTPAAQVVHLSASSLLLGAQTVLLLLARWLPHRFAE
jgi:cytochrome c oxidase assembly protein subunit 15